MHRATLLSRLVVRFVFPAVLSLALFDVSGFCKAAEPLQAHDSEYKLQPLKYNHPGLVVDLGVGLWAFPMPIDYDRDGDLDLLVGCPDKPSNGTYFFENSSQNPQAKQPVFKPAVRIGKGFHFMMLSRVKDESIILTPAKEFRRTPSGTFDFDKPTKIPAPINPNRQAKRTRANMWRYVDFDGDEDQDLVVGSGDWTDLGWDHAYDSQGNWRNGPLHGYVYVMLNSGSDAKPSYDEPVRLQAGGSDVDVYGWPSPNFGDFDHDGDLDLLCGEFLDGFTYFQNVGSRRQPQYAVGKRVCDASGRQLAMHVQMITPTAIDWDQDGDLDLVVGDEDGRVALVENTGEIQSAMPVFNQPRYFQQEADTLKFGALATPYAYDWDGDGDQDILCGNTSGNIGLFENLGAVANGLPKWSAPTLLEVHEEVGASESKQIFRVLAGPSGSIQGPCEAKWGYTTLSVADWDQDGNADIIYNSILGRLGMLENKDGDLLSRDWNSGVQELPPKWSWWQTPDSTTLTQWRTTPLALDFDGDKQLDLVMLDQEGFLTLRRGGKKAERVFVDENFNALRLNSGSCGRSGRVKLAMVDWDTDGKLDILVNSENATWYRNVGTDAGRVVLKKVGNLAKRNVSGHTSSPAVCDFDQDGEPDLLVGSENGRIYHIAHGDCVQFTALQKGSDQAETESQAEYKEPRFQGLVKEEFVYEKAPFKQCHASTICETSRGLVAAWFGGTREKNPDVGIWVSYHDGLKWSLPLEVANGIQHQDLRYPCWNPVLYQPPGDAPTLLFFKVGPSPSSWWGELMVSYDRGRTFVNRRRLPEGIDGPVRCKPILLGDGETLLCGSSTEYEGWRVHFESVELENGEPGRSSTWKRIGPINDASQFNAIQPTFLQHADGSLQVLCRTKEGVVASSSSNDEGSTWTKLEATSLPNPNSGIEAVTLKDGRHLLVYNPLDSGNTGWGKRSILSLAISDDGKDWRRLADLEKEQSGEFSYPAIIQSEDGLVHVTYTWKRTRVKHVVIDPAKLQ